MKSYLKVGLPGAAIAILMGATNPEPEAYSTYVANRVMSKGEKVACSQFKICGGGKIPKPIEAAARIAIKPAVDAATTRRNLVFLSFYRTEIPGVGTMKTIGALGRFFTYSETRSS